MKINVVLPFFSNKPVGGIKIMYQYADLLSEKGHEVIIYHTKILKNSPSKILNPLRLIKQLFFKKDVKPIWYKFEHDVATKLICSISNKYIEDADVILSTMYATALDVFSLSPNKGKKFNLIQDYETWISSEDKIISSYKLPVQHIVINDYLFAIVAKASTKQPVLIYNAIDEKYFKIIEPIENRNKESICMMYSEEKRKGSNYGLDAIKICKSKHPNLKVTFFSVFPRPDNIPQWIDYFQSPKNLVEIYNKSAIFLSPSTGEGWALPPAEAMSCGCALVCSDIGGHAAYAIDEQTALLTKSMNVNDISEKILFLIENNKKRISIAECGNSYIKKFSWELSVNKLEEVLKH